MILHDQRRQSPSERLRNLQPEDKSQVIRTRRPAPGHRPKLQSHDTPANACAVSFSPILYRCTVIPSHAITSCPLRRGDPQPTSNQNRQKKKAKRHNCPQAFCTSSSRRNARRARSINCDPVRKTYLGTAFVSLLGLAKRWTREVLIVERLTFIHALVCVITTFGITVARIASRGAHRGSRRPFILLGLFHFFPR